jgi:hypothetical protein
MQKLAAAGIATAALAALAAQALASSADTVHLAVPSKVNAGQKFTVTAAGKTNGGANLGVYLSTHKCAASAAGESGATRLIDSHVAGVYSHAKKATATGSGKQYACGYLTSGTHTLAHASKSYTVTADSGPQITQFVVTPAPEACTAAYFNVTVKDTALLSTLTLDYGDGTNSTISHIGELTYQNLFQHGYTQGGSFTAKLTVTDVHGKTAVQSKTFNNPACS